MKILLMTPKRRFLLFYLLIEKGKFWDMYAQGLMFYLAGPQRITKQMLQRPMDKRIKHVEYRKILSIG